MIGPIDYSRYENMVGQDVEARFAKIDTMSLADLIDEAKLYVRAIGVTESVAEKWSDRIVARLAELQ